MADTNKVKSVKTGNFLEEFNNAVKSLESEAKEAGTTLTEACRETGVSRASPDRWRSKPPKTVQLLAKLQDYIRGRAKEPANDK